VAQRVDAQAVALDQPALTRNRAGPGAAHLARPAVLPGAPGLHPAPERGPAVGLILARVDAGAPTRELPRGTDEHALAVHALLAAAAGLPCTASVLAAARRRSAELDVRARIDTGPSALDQARLAGQLADAVAAD